MHADKSGIFQRLEVDATLNAEVVEEDLWVKPGDLVHGFEGANDAIGTLVLRFENSSELERNLQKLDKWISVIVK